MEIILSRHMFGISQLQLHEDRILNQSYQLGLMQYRKLYSFKNNVAVTFRGLQCKLKLR